MRNYDLTFTVLIATAFYLWVGNCCWNHLLTHAATVEDAELIGMSRTTFWGAVGKGIMILLWPIWTVGGAIYFRTKEAMTHETDANFATASRLD